MLPSNERIRQIEAKALRRMRYPTRMRQLHGFVEVQRPRWVRPTQPKGTANEAA